MPTATNGYDNVRIHYELHGAGPALLMHHGGGGSLERWYELGYVEALSRNFRLVLVDARGHGQSDRPHDPQSYRYERWVSDLVAVLDDAGIERAHFFGYSLGALIGFRIPKYAPHRFDSLILGGAHPYAQYDFFNRQYENFKDGLETYQEIRRREGNLIGDAELAHLQSADLKVFSVVGEALREEPGAMEHLTVPTLPMLLLLGGNDATDGSNQKLPVAARKVPGSTLLMFAGLDHREMMARSDLVVPYLKVFWQTCATA
jgi:pimeloyl-ACP methyl ester carboxylesterase